MSPPAVGTRYFVLTGLPASGKSALARELAWILSLPVIDKDDVLEVLFQQHQPGDVHARRELSRAADLIFEQRARDCEGAVLVSWWRHPRSQGDSGTPTPWLESLPGARTEVYCACSPATAADRFLRRVRHPGHLDARWTRPELLASFERAAALGPLGVGDLVEVATDGADYGAEDVCGLAQAVMKASHRGSHTAAR